MSLIAVLAHVSQRARTALGTNPRGEIRSTRLGSGIVAAGGLSPLALPQARRAIGWTAS
jgi:hypothetical protein